MEYNKKDISEPSLGRESAFPFKEFWALYAEKKIPDFQMAILKNISKYLINEKKILP